MLIVEKLTVQRLGMFAKHMRPEDWIEWYHASKLCFAHTPIAELSNALCCIDEDTREVYAIGAIEGQTIWVVCTTAVNRNPITFLRFCKPYFKQWVKTPVSNYVWTKNRAHVKWLKWLGAKFYQHKEINGEPFQKFILYPVKE